jgi:PPK2 family polyphosphate:nucleotide phosphotransferase
MGEPSLKTKNLFKGARRLAKRFRVTNGRTFRLKDFDPAETLGLDEDDKSRAKKLLKQGVEALSELQDRLYAQDRWALLLIFQAMDAAGKDGAIKHVMSGVNPQGCQVFSFKAPSAEDLDHDYMWRCVKCLPERGRIGIFNRSYYEETLVVRVHPELLDRQRLPTDHLHTSIWKQRYREMRHFEEYLTANGIVVRKFFLHVSRGEQRKRLLARMDDATKNWKFSASDAAERQHWHAYMNAYEDMIRATATGDAPWYVVPADNKWFTRLVVAAAVADALDSLDLQYPRTTRAQRKELAAARAALS